MNIIIKVCSDKLNTPELELLKNDKIQVCKPAKQRWLIHKKIVDQQNRYWRDWYWAGYQQQTSVCCSQVYQKELQTPILRENSVLHWNMHHRIKILSFQNVFHLTPPAIAIVWNEYLWWLLNDHSILLGCFWITLQMSMFTSKIL